MNRILVLTKFLLSNKWYVCGTCHFFTCGATAMPSHQLVSSSRGRKPQHQAGSSGAAAATMGGSSLEGTHQVMLKMESHSEMSEVSWLTVCIWLHVLWLVNHELNIPHMLFNILRIIRVSVILTNVRFVLKFVSGMVNDIYKIDLKYILRVWTYSSGLVCEYGDESLGPIKCREFIDQLSDSQPLRRWKQTFLSLYSKNWGKSDHPSFPHSLPNHMAFQLDSNILHILTLQQ